jgi:type IV pilus assembly protein PilB
VSEPHRLGEILVNRGLITPGQLEEALRRQGATGGRLGEVLIAMGALTEEQLDWALSEALQIPFVELSDDVVDLEVARSLPEDLLRRHQAVPILRVGDELTVLVADPTDRQAAVEIEALTGARVTLALAARDAVRHFLDRAFPGRGRSGDASAVEIAAPPAAPAADLSGVSQVFSLLLDAVREEASEVYVEPGPEAVVVRARIRGRLVERARHDRGLLMPITFRLRRLAGLRSEAAPRVARVRTQLEGRAVDLELLFFPTLAGEAVTIRIEAVVAEAPTLDGLGVDGATRSALTALLRPPATAGAPGGLVLVVGPEARARAEVLYALAGDAAVPGGRVLSVERRAAFVVPAFLQVELPDDFAGAAPAVLRQGADVLLVEDLLPAAVAVAALARAQEGALVLGGLEVGSPGLALAHLGASDLRGPLLALARGVVGVRRRAGARVVEVVPLSQALRRGLLGRRGAWTSPSC